MSALGTVYGANPILVLVCGAVIAGAGLTWFNDWRARR